MAMKKTKIGVVTARLTVSWQLILGITAALSLASGAHAAVSVIDDFPVTDTSSSSIGSYTSYQVSDAGGVSDSLGEASSMGLSEPEIARENENSLLDIQAVPEAPKTGLFMGFGALAVAGGSMLRRKPGVTGRE